MKCSACGAEASGNFCASCGTPLGEKSCSSCGAKLQPGSRFCTACGTPLSGDPGRGGGGGTGGEGSKLAWWMAGVFLVLLLGALGYPILTRDDGMSQGGQVAPGMGGESGGAGLVDLTTMPLGEQATTLFNRVMASNSAGDTADVNFFLPKALVIHEQLNPTDPDGIYHFALLHQVGGDFEAALSKAQEGLADAPDYLLLLAVAAEASSNLGDAAQAAEYYQRFVAVYDREIALARLGYDHHQPILPVYREEALAYLNEG